MSGVDYKNLKKFARAMENVEKEMPMFLNDFFKQQAHEAIRLTKYHTPVDTGNLRDNWYLSDIQKEGQNLIVYLINEIDYASWVEYGHETVNKKSFVPGVYMSTLSIQEVEHKIPDRFNKSLIQFLARKGLR